MSRVNEAGNYTKPKMRKNLFNKIKAGGKGGRPGQWSARKAQMLALQYKKAGAVIVARAKSQRSLMNWTKQKWRTKSGKPSTQGPKATGERYLPSAAIKNMSASQYAASTRKKREDTKKGKQHSKQPRGAARTAARYR